jgi:hypothetical protein
MHPVLRKTIGGLSQAYFLRQLFFSLLMAALVCSLASSSSTSPPLRLGFFIIVNTVLYPYARYVYESFAGCIAGRKPVFSSAALALAVTILTMALCWAGALVIAPIGMAYLYFRHSKAERQEV